MLLQPEAGLLPKTIITVICISEINQNCLLLKGAFNRKNREAYVHRKLFHETSQGIIKDVTKTIDCKTISLLDLKNTFRR